MINIISRDRLTEIFDGVIREITRQVVGVNLSPGELSSAGERYTVYIKLDDHLGTGLSFCAERAVFIRVAQCMIMEEDISSEDMEAVAQEYLNILCGHIAARLFPATKTPVRFSVPAFYPGRYVPEGYAEHIVLTYTSDQQESAQLIHCVPAEGAYGAAAWKQTKGVD